MPPALARPLSYIWIRTAKLHFTIPDKIQGAAPYYWDNSFLVYGRRAMMATQSSIINTSSIMKPEFINASFTSSFFALIIPEVT